MTKLTIAGGVYREICQFPEKREILGSGGRAAAAVSSMNSDVELHAFFPDSALSEVRLSLLGAYDFALVQHTSANLFAFRWTHGLASPQQEPALPRSYQDLEMEVGGDVVLRYGMVEGAAKVAAEYAVYDPQAPLHAGYFRANGSIAKHLAYVVNSAEAKLLTESEDPYTQLTHLHRQENAEVVVLKQGPHGAIVSDGVRTERVPCFKTGRVIPIGSGDVFSAVFCQAWAIERLSPVDAAYRASLATASYCNSGYLPLDLDFMEHTAPDACRPTVTAGERRQIYLAGPFFTVAQRWLIDSLRETFLKLDVDVFSPIHDAGEGRADIVAHEDLRGIDHSDVVFAVCDGLDAGTLFEVGYAVSRRKPVIAFTQLEKADDLTMLEGTGCLIERDLDTAIYKAVWTALER
ncbi:PfkB family carbohydrate kinase [Paraburkholderia sp. D1E]|uniref:PfkB family carbohydrate kinase n=1 Tax=Paraburkholderia sp. D1E TaxID=3461398 RepID=UPI00404656AE